MISLSYCIPSNCCIFPPSNIYAFFQQNYISRLNLKNATHFFKYKCQSLHMLPYTFINGHSRFFLQEIAHHCDWSLFTCMNHLFLKSVMSGLFCIINEEHARVVRGFEIPGAKRKVDVLNRMKAWKWQQDKNALNFFILIIFRFFLNKIHRYM